MIKKKSQKYDGFSLVEMLITIAIIGMVMLISSTTLTSLIKISTVSSNKIRARNETEFVLELIRRTVRNSDPSDVFIFKTDKVRAYNPDEGNITVIDSPEISLEEAYAQSLDESMNGNEIHFRPYGYRDWICIAFFKSPDQKKGYIMRTSSQDLFGNHQSCFGGSTPGSYFIVLNSDYVNINNFNISYTISSDTNYIIKFDIEAEPTDWYLGRGAPIQKKVFRQGVVSTEGLIW